MAETWHLLDADERERRAFASLDATLHAAGERVGEPNRFREVRTVDVDGRRYWLKVFTRTQWKNRVRNFLTRPHADLDAERECAVADALRRRGVATARTVAVGHRGPSSFYLSADLAGTAVAALLRHGRFPPARDRELAAFLGGAFARGLVLPDLSAEHVFLLDGGGFGLIDLHNGRVGRADLRDLSRALRRASRSVAGLVGRTRALRFASAFLTAAGARTFERHVLARVPPLDTHGRYDRARAAAYATRAPQRAAREEALLASVWPGRPDEDVLDVPCGAGRLADFVRRRGGHWSGADRSPAMLGEAHARSGGAPLVLADAARLPFADRAFDGVVLFRFLHHLDQAGARAVVDDAARVAARFVVLTFFHPVSAHAVARRVRCAVERRARTRHPVSLGTLRSWLGAHGFRLADTAADLPFVRDLWVASFVRDEPAR